MQMQSIPFDLTVPVVLVVPVVLGLVAALGWLARRYDRLLEKSIGLRARRRESAVMLREALREKEPDLEPLSYDDSSDLLEVEYNKDRTRIQSLRPALPKTPRLSPDQEERVKRYSLTGDPSTPPDPVRPIRKPRE